MNGGCAIAPILEPWAAEKLGVADDNTFKGQTRSKSIGLDAGFHQPRGFWLALYGKSQNGDTLPSIGDLSS